MFKCIFYFYVPVSSVGFVFFFLFFVDSYLDFFNIFCRLKNCSVISGKQ